MNEIRIAEFNYPIATSMHHSSFLGNYFVTFNHLNIVIACPKFNLNEL